MTAFAFQMGAVTYSMRDRLGRVSEAIYKPCVGALLGDMSQSCEVTPVKILPENIMAGIADVEGKTIFFVFDTAQTMVDKATNVMRSPTVRDHFTWLLLNVHLTDFSAQCLSNPYERVTNFKTFLLHTKPVQSG
ncbi:uncharacterized protein LOC144097476 [Amblyomma americanum]